MSFENAQIEEGTVKLFLARRKIKMLENAHGNGTGMITLIVRPDEQLHNARKLLDEEYGTASNIRSRVNRQAVMDAITAAQQKLRLFTRPPPNGLAIFCGTILTEGNKYKLVKIVLEPYKPVDRSLYKCDSRFHTESLSEQLQNDEKFGFIIVGGEGAMFCVLCGTTREIVRSITVDLPKKHGRGGQSALRFARLRIEKRHNYLRKITEIATQVYITNDRPNVSGLILGGFADLKNELMGSDLFDPRLKAIVIKVVDVSYGGETGFNQAVVTTADELRNVRFVKEMKIVSSFFDQIAKDTDKYKIGVEETLQAAEVGAAETILVSEKLGTLRVCFRNTHTGEKSVRFMEPGGQNPPTKTNEELEIEESISLVEWLAENYHNFGTSLEIISDVSQQGYQFAKGFGIGAILRYSLPSEFVGIDENENDSDLNDIEDEVENSF